MLSVTPISRDNFSWEIMLNWSKNKNKVKSLYGDIQSLTIYDQADITVVAPVNGSYGTIMGLGLKHNEDGKVVVNSSGIPMSDEIRPLGNIMPDWIGGINNTFRYKNFQFNFLIDMRKGGDLYSRTNADGIGAGGLAASAQVNAKGINWREPVADGGGLLYDGVFEDGKPNDQYVGVQDFHWSTANVAERFIYDASFY